MLKILGGDWPAEQNATVKTGLRGEIREILLFTGFLRHDTYKAADIETAELVTQENQTSIAGKMGWGAAGAVALGPVGLLAGAIMGGNRNSAVVAVKFKDGRKVLLQGKSKEVMPLVGAGFR
ncbi:hypothetical protein [Parvibaculum sp. MBR-TMA-1.3b-4.2]|jgi:hypothetical protein